MININKLLRNIVLSKDEITHLVTRAAPIVPGSLNREERTFEIVWTTGARVRRWDWWDGWYYEELSLEESHVRMGRLQNGAPFLDNHGFTEARGVKQTLGVHQSAELIPGKEGRAVIKLSKRTEGDGILDDIEDGILRNVSVGYNAYSGEKVGEENNIPIYRMTDWEPVENSLVPAGADDDAMIRSFARNASGKQVEAPLLRSLDIKGYTPRSEPVGKPSEGSDKGRSSLPDNLRTNKVDPAPQGNPGGSEPTGSTRGVDDKTSNRKESGMEPTSNTTTTDNGAAADNGRGADNNVSQADAKAAADKARAEAKEAEKARQSAIRDLGTKMKLKRELVDEWIEKDFDIEKCRELAIDARAKEDQSSDNNTRSGNSNVEVGEDVARQARIRGMGQAILHRFRPKATEERANGVKIIRNAYEMTEEAKPYAYRSLSDLAEMCLRENGFDTRGLPRHKIAERALQLRAAHSISDFSEILANTVNRTLRDGYMAVPQTWRNFTNVIFVPDFKEITRTQLGEGSKLEKLQELGEIKRGTVSEAAEKYRIETFARILGISRQVIVNDDLNAMTRIPDLLGRRAADLESDVAWAEIKTNPTMADGQALFSAAHGNLSLDPGAPNETRLQEARKFMRRQKGLDDQEISIVPVYLYVPPEHETVAEKLTASIVPDSSTNVSPFSQSGRTPLQPVVEPRIETGDGGSINQWFIMASMDQVDMVEMAMLEGTDGPQIATREGFDVEGVEVKVTHDVGAKALDHRGFYKNAGA